MPSILPLCSATPFRALFPNTLTLHSRPQPNFLLHPTCDSAFFTAAVRRRRPFRLPPRFAFLLPRHFAFSHPRRIITATSLTTLALASATAYYTYDPFRHFCSAVVRCSRAGWVGAAIAVDYKWSLRESRVFASEEEKKKVKSDVHKRSAEKVYEALVKSGGIYIKLGQHVSAMAYLLPIEWTSTMRPLQDRCPPTPLPAIEQLILTDIGSPLSTLFSDFDPNPIGVASLAQVHRATLRATGQPVAVKIQHPYLDDYAAVDMKTVEVIIGITTRLFPEFGFGWLSEEMNESLPVEMDFECEARNAERVRTNFKKDIEKGRTTLRIPKIVWAKRRVLCMEFIEGSRLDNIAYLRAHRIDPNQVSAELTRIFSKMIYIHGWVHCDPHPGNILIRPRPTHSSSPYNFEVVLLDHGLYRSLTPELRLDYSHLWASLIRGSEDDISYYSRRVGGTSAYQLFASIMTGREWAAVDAQGLSQARTQEELDRIASAVGGTDFLVQIAELLAGMPRIVLLLLKTNDLLRSVNEELRTSGGQHATYVIVGRYCAMAIYDECWKRLGVGLTWRLVKELVVCWWTYRVVMQGGLGMYERWLGVRGWWVEVIVMRWGWALGRLEG